LAILLQSWRKRWGFCQNPEWFQDGRCCGRTAQKNKVNAMAKRTMRTTSTARSKTSETADYPGTYPESTSADQASDMSRTAASDTTRNASMGSEPSEEEIRIRAYRRYLERGGGDGQDFEDWLEAERELKHRS
jgi:hypothetical protein